MATALAPAVVTTTAKPLKSRPQVNLFDMPEIMPGAQPSANPAQREEFEQRCRQLHQEDVSERYELSRTTHVASRAGARNCDIEAMFPALDPALVRLLVAEAPTHQHAIETLLALAAATAEPGADGQRAATSSPLDVGVEDMQKFPSLMDSDGWQVVAPHLFDRAEDEELGSVWRDRAKEVADRPAPKPLLPASSGAWGAPATTKRRLKREQEHNAAAAMSQEMQPETDYEFRQRQGQRRTQNRAQFGRGGGRVRAMRLKGSAQGNDGNDDGGSANDAADDESGLGNAADE